MIVEKTSNRDQEMGACKTGTEAFCFFSDANIKPVGKLGRFFVRFLERMIYQIVERKII